MIYNLRIVLRRIWRQRIHNLINLCGLSIGIASSLIIFLFVINELNYDLFHKNADRIFKIYQHSMIEGEESFDAWTPVPMAQTLIEEYPEVQNAVRLYQSDDLYAITEDKHFNIKHALYADSSFFTVFSFDLVRGDKKTILAEPHTVVLTESTAKKMFQGTDPMNKMIRFENDTTYFRITGISSDPPFNSHFDYDILISMDAFWDVHSDFWLRNNVNTYVLIKEDIPYKRLEEKFPEIIKKYVSPQVQQLFGTTMEEDFAKSGSFLHYKLQPLSDIHLNASINHGLKPSNNRVYVYIFSLIAILILFLAGINFVNLSTARSVEKTHEVIVQKILGSSNQKIIGQFLLEAVILCFISVLTAIILTALLLPYINTLTGLSLNLFIFKCHVAVLSLLVLTVLLGITTGLYPAFILSSFKMNTTQTEKMSMRFKRSNIRNVLVILQFFIAILILSGMFVFYRQLAYMLNKDLGFDKKNVIIIHRIQVLDNQLGAFIEEIRKYDQLKNVTTSTSVPGFHNADNAFMIEGRSASETYVLQTTWVDQSFIGTYKMEISEGRDFKQDLTTDNTGIILNEAAVKKMDLKDPTAAKLIMPLQNGSYNYHPVIGVVKDFHFVSLHRQIQPFAMIAKPAKDNWGGYISIRIGNSNKKQCIQIIESIWKRFTNDRIMEYTFLEDDLNNLYNQEKRISTLSAVFTILSVFIACLGLLGLVMFLSVKRTKEIGIRKTLGANMWNILTLMSKDTVKLIIISSLIAWPVAHFLLKKWLTDFPFRIEMNPVIFLLSTVILLILSLVTIGGCIWYASTRNPAEALRFE